MLKKIFVLALLTGILATSCSKYQRLLKSTDYEEKYQSAFAYYNQGDHYRAIQLFDQVIPFYRGTERAETIAYHYAYAHYKQKDYVLASFYFKRFVSTFPRSQYVEECTFMSAYCKYLDSPKPSLDQTNTREAIDELQLFINKYPQSERVSESNKLIDDLRAKLEIKEVEIARLYYKMENYTAAITAFKNVLKNFPDTDYREEVMFTKLKAHYDYASKSIEERREERYKEALEAYDNFVAQFPDSDYLREANQIQKNVLRQLDSQVNLSIQ
jgi:outer membrane protein assembly factor BamD